VVERQAQRERKNHLEQAGEVIVVSAVSRGYLARPRPIRFAFSDFLFTTLPLLRCHLFSPALSSTAHD
jgi:hypothetical protein